MVPPPSAVPSEPRGLLWCFLVVSYPAPSSSASRDGAAKLSSHRSVPAGLGKVTGGARGGGAALMVQQDGSP